MRLAWLLLAAALAAQQPNREEIGALRRRATEAYGRKDYPLFLELSREVAEKAPRSVRAAYDLARALALAGEKSEAVAALDRLARREVAFDLESEEDFAAIRDDPGFQEVVRAMAALRSPIGASAVAFTLDDPELITEGIAHDPKSGAFFVSSVRRRKIVRVDKNGVSSDFVEDGFYSVIALAVDPERRSLFASSQATPRMERFREEDEGKSFVAEIDLETSTVRRRVQPPATAEGSQLSDIALGPAGDLAIADPYRGRLFLLPLGSEVLRTIVETGPLGSPQGIAWSEDGASLFVADYVQGIARVELRDGTVRLLPAPERAVVTGIDGLVQAGDSLIGIQNGIEPHRVVRLRLDSRRERIEEVLTLERENRYFDEPTLGVRVGSDFYYVANSQYRFANEDGTLALDRLRDPVVLRMALPWIEAQPR